MKGKNFPFMPFSKNGDFSNYLLNFKYILLLFEKQPEFHKRSPQNPILEVRN